MEQDLSSTRAQLRLPKHSRVLTERTSTTDRFGVSSLDSRLAGGMPSKVVLQANLTLYSAAT